MRSVVRIRDCLAFSLDSWLSFNSTSKGDSNSVLVFGKAFLLLCSNEEEITFCLRNSLLVVSTSQRVCWHFYTVKLRFKVHFIVTETHFSMGKLSPCEKDILSPFIAHYFLFCGHVTRKHLFHCLRLLKEAYMEVLLVCSWNKRRKSAHSSLCGKVVLKNEYL